jgi:hypothetical protein
MTDTARNRAKEIQQAIRNTLMRHWDPIGVAATPEAQGEYDSYIGPVYRLLVSGASDAELVKYLCQIETGTLGLGEPAKADHLDQVVTELRKIDAML